MTDDHDKSVFIPADICVSVYIISSHNLLLYNKSKRNRTMLIKIFYRIILLKIAYTVTKFPTLYLQNMSLKI